MVDEISTIRNYLNDVATAPPDVVPQVILQPILHPDEIVVLRDYLNDY